MKLPRTSNLSNWTNPAAFRRLCVETAKLRTNGFAPNQPPSGGCVLKLSAKVVFMTKDGQPPSGGCVLKPKSSRNTLVVGGQPPSGGCVLKRSSNAALKSFDEPAAFRRLCVETPAVFIFDSFKFPAAFRRLCVETYPLFAPSEYPLTSRLQAAVC